MEYQTCVINHGGVFGLGGEGLEGRGLGLYRVCLGGEGEDEGGVGVYLWVYVCVFVCFESMNLITFHGLRQFANICFIHSFLVYTERCSRCQTTNPSSMYPCMYVCESMYASIYPSLCFSIPHHYRHSQSEGRTASLGVYACVSR